MKHSEKSDSSSGRMCRSTTSKPLARASSITDWRVMPSRKQSGVGRVDHPVPDEEDVGAGRLGDIAAPVEHHGVGEALLLGGVLGDGADHVEAGGLGRGRRGLRRGALVLGPGQADALGLLLGLEVARPVPGGDRHVDLGVLGRDADHLRAAPGDRPDIGSRSGRSWRRSSLQACVDLGHRERDLEVEDLGGLEQALGVRASARRSRRRTSARPRTRPRRSAGRGSVRAPSPRARARTGRPARSSRRGRRRERAT